MDELRRLKQASGMTNQQIADASGIPLGTVNRVMSGQTRNPTTDTAAAIREALEGASPAEPDHHEKDACRPECARMSAAYQDMIRRIEDDFRAALASRDEQISAERAVYSRWLRALAIALAVMVLFIMALLLIDIANPNAGWVRAMIYDLSELGRCIM